MNVWLRRGALSVACTIMVGYCVTVFRGPQGFATLQQKREELRLLQEENATLAQEIQRKRERIERLRDSAAEQELVIRERLKMSRPGETTYILPTAQ